MMQMSPVRTHHYAVAEADFEEFTARRATLITAIRAAHPGLTETRLIRQQDGTYTGNPLGGEAVTGTPVTASARLRSGR